MSRPWGAPPLRTFLVVVLVLGGSLFLWKGRETYHLARRVGAERLLPGAQEKVAVGEWDAAMRRLNKAFRLAPQHPPVVREMARLLEQSGRGFPTALSLIDQLERSGALLAPDRLIRARLYVRSGRFEEARDDARAVLGGEPLAGSDRAAALGVLAQVAVALGQEGEAEELLTEAVVADSENFTVRLGLAAVRVRSEFDEVRTAAKDDLWAVAQQPTIEGLRALTVLGGEVGVPSGNEREYIDLLRSNPFSTGSHRLEALRIRLQLEPGRREQLLTDELERTNRLPVKERLLFYRWLLDIGHPEYVGRGIAPAGAKAHPELFRIYIGALLTQGRWEEAEGVLESGGIPLGQAQLHFVRAHLAREAGQPSAEVRSELRRAAEFAAVEKFPGLAIEVGEMAESLGFTGVAETGFRTAARSPGTAPIARQRLAELLRHSGDAEALLDLVEDGDSPEMEREATYLKLLLGDEIELQHARAFEALARDPSSPVWQLNAALAAWRMTDSGRARDLAQRLAADHSVGRLDVGKRAVLGGILGRALPPLAGGDGAGTGLETLLLKEEKAFPLLP